MAGSQAERDRPVEQEESQEGIGITFANPELLRAYILDPQRQSPATIPEIMSGIRAVRLGEMPLDGDLFTSATFTLVIEPDRNPRDARPTAIIRADLRLGEKESALSRLHLGGVNKTAKDEEEYIDGMNGYFSSLSNGINASNSGQQEQISLFQWGRTTARISGPLTKEEYQKMPTAILQLWDPDVGAGSISTSLFSYGKYHEDWMKRSDEVRDKIRDGLVIDIAEPDTWHFGQRVGVDVYHEEQFRDGLSFFEDAFSKTVSAIYKHEGVPVPTVSYEIEPPLIFKEDKIVTFADIGGQKEAVSYLRGVADSEKKNIRVVSQGRSVLLEGPVGNGKSSLVKALAHELKAPLVTKTTLDLPRKEEHTDIIGLFDAWHLEAKSLAKRSGGKAVYCVEGLEVFLQNPMHHDMFLNMLERWENDPEVLFVGTSNFPENLHPGIRSRFTELSILSPRRDGIREILQIHIAKIAGLLGQDVFAQVDLSRIAQRLEGNKNISGREIVKFLGGAFSLSKLKAQAITTDSLLNLLPDQRLGFRTPQ